MPIYEYECRKCGEQFELLVLSSTVAACPACENQDLEQLLSGFAVSSDGIRKSNLASARLARKNSKNVRDQKIAHVEDIKEHTGQH